MSLPAFIDRQGLGKCGFVLFIVEHLDMLERNGIALDNRFSRPGRAFGLWLLCVGALSGPRLYYEKSAYQHSQDNPTSHLSTLIIRGNDWRWRVFASGRKCNV